MIQRSKSKASLSCSLFLLQDDATDQVVMHKVLIIINKRRVARSIVIKNEQGKSKSKGTFQKKKRAHLL
jgi:hypothetical protein